MVSVPSTGDHWKQKPSLANRLGVQLPGFRELVDEFWGAGGKTVHELIVYDLGATYKII